MTEVLRCLSHGSQVIVSMIDRKNGSYFQKSSYWKEGIEDLKKEIVGIKWYNSRNGMGLRVESCEINGLFFEITVEKVDHIEPIRKPLIRRNLAYYKLAIDTYRDIWCCVDNDTDNYPVHGDYSLDGNILFQESKTVIIDWEHFEYSCAPLGFDLLYLIFEAIKIRSGKRLPNAHTMECAEILIKYARSLNLLSPQYNENIFGNFIQMQTEITHVWNGQTDKVPTFHFTEQQHKFLVHYFGNV